MKEDHCRLSRWQLLKSQLNNLDPVEFKRMFVDADGAVLIDCRTSGEFAQTKLAGAVNIDYLAPGFWDEIERLDPQKPYLVYCRSGRRSIRTCTLMKNGGFQAIYNLDGGLNAWLAVYGEELLVREAQENEGRSG